MRAQALTACFDLLPTLEYIGRSLNNDCGGSGLGKVSGEVRDGCDDGEGPAVGAEARKPRADEVCLLCGTRRREGQLLGWVAVCLGGSGQAVRRC
jgi:hypothetical protein